ncbi:MAG: hypothetical protein J6M31_08335 [Bacteroidales bacterium]|nr:hypothetical protein [Bacteroidales bacterium]
MKKFGLILLTLTALAACSKGRYEDYDTLGGHTYITGGSVGRSYMMSIADDLMAGVLDEMVLARETQKSGATASSHFKINGNFNAPGSEWSVYSETSLFKGLTIRCAEENFWGISYEGDFPIYGVFYPTTFTMTATLEESGAWKLFLNGAREERGGYHCTFETRAGQNSDSRMVFQNTLGTGVSGWNRIKGDLFLTVYKNKEVVDVSRLSFNGTPSQATYTRGL